jgi:hypothetical protein
VLPLDGLQVSSRTLLIAETRKPGSHPDEQVDGKPKEGYRNRC